MSENLCEVCGSQLVQIGGLDACPTCDKEELKNCPFCGGKARVTSEWYKRMVCCDNPKCQNFDLGLPLETWNNRPIEEALEGIIAILEFYRDDTKSIVPEAIEMLEEIAFHEKVPARWHRVLQDLKKLVSREPK